MPPKKYAMDELSKKSDEKFSSFEFDFVSDLKKEIMNEVKAILSEYSLSYYCNIYWRFLCQKFRVVEWRFY